uniref:Putative PBS lyase HEAT-like repeat protein n=1 Tax=uncultured marine microorganism HF4000_APKG10F17 TaxID=455558 RepID=B3TBZ7_9ZZZZ|nr:putative PBS lyase HEAT-like repeat protein [uncultured marine microorganism HF4000_APKG10F17]
MVTYRKSTPAEVKGYAKHYAENGDYITAIDYYEEIGETGEISGLLGKFEKEDPVNFRAYKMRTANDVDGLIKAVEYFDDDDDSLFVVMAAARELGKLGDKRAVGPLIGVLENNKLAPVCRSKSATALGKLGDNRAVEPLTKILTAPEKEHETDAPDRDESEDGESWVEPSMIKSWKEEHEQFISEGGFWHDMLYGEIRSFRSHVAQALGELGDKRTVEILIGMLEPKFDMDTAEMVAEDNKVRDGVALALGKLGKRGVEGSELAVEPLLNTLRDDSPNSQFSNRASESGSDDDFELRGAVHEALTSFGEAIAPQLILFLKQNQITVPQDIDSDYPILTTISPAAIGAEFERQEMYDEADKWYNSQGMLKEAADARRKKADMSASKTEIHGDYVDDRDTIIKDSVISKSNIGSGGSSKMQELKELKEMFDSGFISKEEMEEMKKEILGK